MKKLLFVLVFAFIGFQEILSQNYIEMLAYNCEWQVTYCNNGCNTDVYFTDGDTLYNGHHYKILNGYHFISKTFWLREDVQDQKVYMSFLKNNLRREVLLYDFNMETGDSINIYNPISPFNANPGFYVVDSIVSLQLQNNQYYDHFFLSPRNLMTNESSVWIEGIGSLSLINAPGGTPNVNGVGKLSCFFDNSDLAYSQLDSINSCILSNPIITNNKSTNINKDRKLIGIKNLLGNKTDRINPNTLLLYLFNDGTVDKRIVIE